MAQWNSILQTKPQQKKDEEEVKKEADVIITATVLGFIGTRYHLDQPCSFDIEHPSPQEAKAWAEIDEAIMKKGDLNLQQEFIKGLWESIQWDTKIDEREADPRKEEKKAIKAYKSFLKDYQDFLDVLSAMSEVLNQTDKNIGTFLKDSQSPEWSTGALITGSPGGQRLPFKAERIRATGSVFQENARHRQIESRLAKRFAERVKRGEKQDLYQGRGAYTGMIDDPVGNKSLVQATKRVIDNNPRRWHPDPQSIEYWGLIGREQGDQSPNLSTDPKQGMGLLPEGSIKIKGNKRIGYIHGMSSAIEQCVYSGPWCTPFEMATGNQTTKMASCFPCCTYMYAAGFPPSSMHLGRGESWVPPSEDLVTGETTPMPIYQKAITSSLSTRWHREVYGYMLLGQMYLNKAVETNLVNPIHTDAVNKLGLALKNITTPNTDGGNLFLDALTIHDSEWKRIQRILQPAIQKLKGDSKANQEKFKAEKQKKALAQSFSNSYSDSPPVTPLTRMGSSDKPVLLNGMKVIFDQPVGVYPVNLESKEEVRRSGT